jgi:hypothetical protein
MVARAPLLATLHLVGVVLAALILSTVVVQALTGRARGRAAPVAATAAGEPEETETSTDTG